MIINKTKFWLHRFLRKFNYDLVRCPYGDLRKRLELIGHYKIKTIFDIGANIGEFAETMMDAGYRGRIISFEPRKEAFAVLLQKTKKDPRWQCVNIALGDTEGTVMINVSGNQASSSLLEMSRLHVETKPHSRYIGREEIVLKKLDSLIADYIEPGEEIYLKIDTQGYEKPILQGAEKILAHVRIVQLEMSLVELYRGGTLIFEMIPFMESRGFFLSSIERGFHDKRTGRLLQVDGIFVKLAPLQPGSK
jgi:FkbM family methyltransferase